MRNKRHAELLTRLVEHARYEVLPTPSAEEAVLTHLPRDRVITVTASPSKGLSATLDLAERLAGHGYTSQPHLAARMVHGRGSWPRSATVSPAGHHPGVRARRCRQDGTYPDALTLLEDLADLGRPFSHVGITGYPESHPTIDDLTVQSMWDKRRYATHVVSNLTFDPLIRACAADARPRDHDAAAARPAGSGRAGQAGRDGDQDRRGESTRFWSSTRTLARLAARAASPASGSSSSAPRAGRARCGVEGLHVFTFNQIAATEAWREDQLAGCGPEAAQPSTTAASAARDRSRRSPRPSAAGPAGPRPRRPVPAARCPAPGPATPPACSARSTRRAAPATGPAELLEHRPCERAHQEVGEHVGPGLLVEEAFQLVRAGVEVVAVQPLQSGQPELTAHLVDRAVGAAVGVPHHDLAVRRQQGRRGTAHLAGDALGPVGSSGAGGRPAATGVERRWRRRAGRGRPR